VREDIHFEEAPNCAIGKSGICDGQGLFALKSFFPCDVVVDYSNNFQNWTTCSFEDIPDEHRQYMWWVGIDNTECKLAFSQSAFMRANHSKNPNTDWFPKQKQLIANKTIFPGEEITYNYTKEIAPLSIKLNVPSWI
jgi:hypothetical protein